MTPDPITSSPVLSLTPQTLNDLWQSDDGVRVGLLMGVLSDDEKADLSVRYWNWLNRHDIPLAQVRDSFEIAQWNVAQTLPQRDLTLLSRRVYALIDTTGCDRRVAIIAVLLGGTAVQKEAA